MSYEKNEIIKGYLIHRPEHWNNDAEHVHKEFKTWRAAVIWYNKQIRNYNLNREHLKIWKEEF